MADSKIMADIKKHVRDKFPNHKDVSVNAKFVEDLGADSIDCLEFVLLIEEMYGIDIPDDKLDTMKTVGDVITTVEKIIKGT